jgi:hypothetical protein
MDIAEKTKAPSLVYKFECFGPDGRLKWTELVRNLVTTEGKNALLSIMFDAATQVTTWYCGLKGSGSANAADTLASHAGWSEVTDYTGNRKAVTWGSASSGSLAASSAVSFAIDDTATVAGALLASVDTGTSGTLYSAGDFAVPRSVANGDTVNVTPTVTAA